jgi:AcrR family transcriptional regulator
MSTAERRVQRRQHREQTRSQIVAAAEAFLRERPYRDMTVEALMSQTGHSRTVFYRHFEDFPALVLAVLQDVGAELFDVSKRWVDSIDTGELAARDALALIVDFWMREGPLIHAIVEAAHHDDEVDRIYQGFRTMYDEMTEEALRREVDAGRITGIDPRETSRAMNAMNERYLLDSFGREPRADRDAVLDALTTIWQRVLFRPPA